MKIQFKSSEVLILLAASLMSFLANLPDSMVGTVVDKKVILAALIALVVVAMFRYLQAMLLLTISILAIGANLPSNMATSLGISQVAMLISLAVLIAAALLNRFLKFLPTGIETPAEKIANARQAMLDAIEKGDMASLRRILGTNANVNFTQNGTTPLHLAAEKGYPEIVKLLISHGAVFYTKNASGQTPLDVALTKKKFIQTTEILFNANKSLFVIPGKEEPRRGDDEMWREQSGF